MDIVLEIAPNNEVRLGVQSIHSTPKKRTDSTGVLARTQLDRILADTSIEVIEGFSNYILTGASTVSQYTLLGKEDAEYWHSRQKRSLDFISEFQQVVKRYVKKGHSGVGYGRLGRGTSFSKFARRKMLAAGAVLEDKYECPERSVLVTLTIPGNHKSARDVVPRYSGYIMNRLLQVIRRDDKDVEPEFKTDWLYCWEYQRRNWLHLHLCIADYIPGNAERLGNLIKEKWIDILHELSEETGQCLFTNASGKACWLPEFWQNDVSPVRKSVACYLSKYVSKGGRSERSHKSDTAVQPYPVARWWGMSRPLTKAVADASSKVTVTGLTEDEATSIACQIADSLSMLGITSQYSYSFDIEGSGRHIGAGTYQVMYTEPSKFKMVALTIGNLLRSLTGDVATQCVKGKNWLLASFGFDSVELPSYHLNGVTTIKNPYGSEQF